MDKKNKKTTDTLMSYIDELSNFKTIIDKFVDRPTNTNLEKLNEVASMYTDAWIQHWANEDADVFEKLSPSQDLAAHFTHDFMEATESIEDFLEKNPSERESFLKLKEIIKNTWDPNEHFDELNNDLGLKDQLMTREFRENKDSFSKQQEEAIKQELAGDDKIDKKPYLRKGPDRLVSKEIARTISPDSNLKIISYSVFLPAGRYGQDKFLVEKDLDFIQHSMRATRPSSNTSRLLNRRWYFERGDLQDSNSPKMAWWADRNEFRSMLKAGAETGMFAESFNDERIDSLNVIKSTLLDDDEREEIFKTFTFPHERADFDEGQYSFIVAESKYPKAPSQMIDQTFHSNDYLWRDVAIVSPHLLTIRSATNDQLHKPSEKIPDSGWVISNDMTSVSNQVMREFIPLIYPGLKFD
tara:strand:+ start:5528 stop:6763 length:1236 start_codon:yes stop_codon:yes gene_type:complete